MAGACSVTQWQVSTDGWFSSHAAVTGTTPGALELRARPTGPPFRHGRNPPATGESSKHDAIAASAAGALPGAPARPPPAPLRARRSPACLSPCSLPAGNLPRPTEFCSVKDCRGLNEGRGGYRWLGAPLAPVRSLVASWFAFRFRGPTAGRKRGLLPVDRVNLRRSGSRCPGLGGIPRQPALEGTHQPAAHSQNATSAQLASPLLLHLVGCPPIPPNNPSLLNRIW